jgi:tripartite-type tricarboxylate transporter receptor subunit TctC
MKLTRRKVLHMAAGTAAALAVSSRLSWAQSYPSRPVRIVVGFPPGGGADITARLIGQWLSERLGQPFIIDNRPGAGGNIATEAVTRAPSDGYTLLLILTTNAVNATLYENLNFSFVRDIMPIASIDYVPNVMVVHPSFTAKTIPEFIAYSKRNPGKVNIGSGGVGAPMHISGELFKMMAGIDVVHVSYRGAGPALIDLLAGQTHAAFPTMPAAIEHIRAGKLRALGVTTATRVDALPDVPAISEFIPTYESVTWFGIGAPRDTPVEIVEKLNREINTAFADAKMKARLAQLGGTILGGSSDDFAILIANETGKWAKVIRAANIRPK